MTVRVLIVDDQEETARGLGAYLEDHGYTYELATSGPGALLRLGQGAFAAVISDLRIAGMDGLTLLESIHRQDPTLPVFIMSAFGSIESALEAVKRGAFHYFAKPLKSAEVLAYLQRAVEHRALTRQREQLLRQAQDRYTFEQMVGRSEGMRRVFDLIDRVAGSPASVLIQGESGTGKELVARALHYRGPRCHKPFVPVNCAAIPGTLLESELFGFEKGAFTGALRARAGLVAEAAGGTLFLDEIGDLPLELQPKLLRLLQDGEVRPVGSDKVRHVEVRVVTATHQDLKAQVAAGTFRQDLYYRLSVVPVHLPPLRERREDIPLLAERLLQKITRNQPPVQLSKEALEVLMRYPWPGNVRELENALERAATLCTDRRIGAQDVDFLIADEASPLPSLTGDLPTLRELEQRYIELVLRSVDGNKTRAATILGVDPSTLYRRGKREF